MSKKWNDYTRREKMMGVTAAIFGVFLLGSAVNGVSSSSTSTDMQNASPATSETTSKEPVVTYKDETKTESIAFEKTTVNDATRAKGESTVTVAGVNGVRTLTYKITLTDGVETDRELTSSVITTAPVNEVTSIGTYEAPKQQASSCDPNYSGACVPIASDVDCGGGSGNGPEYLYGTAYVIGSDIYGLDRDNDGIACE